eukprot:2732761-Amphidinium_carterae.1
MNLRGCGLGGACAQAGACVAAKVRFVRACIESLLKPVGLTVKRRYSYMLLYPRSDPYNLDFHQLPSTAIVLCLKLGLVSSLEMGGNDRSSAHVME